MIISITPASHFTRQSGGEWKAVGFIRAKSIQDAATKLGCDIVFGDNKEGRLNSNPQCDLTILTHKEYRGQEINSREDLEAEILSAVQIHGFVVE